MDGDWEEVKKPAKTAPKPQAAASSGGPTRYGGKAGKVLIAGAVNPPGGRYGNQSAAAAQQDYDGGNHAQNVADYDFGVDDDTHEEMKFEMVSHTCANAVKQARMDASKTQAQLAKACNEKTTTIVEIENGTARYNADCINRIERALGVKIERGRKKKRGGGKR